MHESTSLSNYNNNRPFNIATVCTMHKFMLRSISNFFPFQTIPKLVPLSLTPHIIQLLRPTAVDFH